MNNEYLSKHFLKTPDYMNLGYFAFRVYAKHTTSVRQQHPHTLYHTHVSIQYINHTCIHYTNVFNKVVCPLFGERSTMSTSNKSTIYIYYMLPHGVHQPFMKKK